MRANGRLRSAAACVLAAFGLAISAVNAAPVPESAALQVAKNYITSHIALHGTWNGVLDPQIESVELVRFAGDAIAYNVVVRPSGHLLVAYDDDFSPVLLYSDKSTFDPAQVEDPNSVAAWILPETHAVYRGLRKSALEAGTPELLALQKVGAPSTKAWSHFNRRPDEFVPLAVATEEKSGESQQKDTLSKAGPILTTSWDQQVGRNAPYLYNLYTPADTGCTHVLTGCVATAAAQLMKYWSWPDVGAGSSSYTWRPPSGAAARTLSASYSHPYNWSSMPDKLTSTSTSAQVDAVARLMSDLGIANSMGYGCASSSSSTQNMATVILPLYFKYRNTVQIVSRSAYTATSFFNALRAEFDAVPARPVLYRMSSTAGDGHAVVADGYQTGTTNMVHVNMGWGSGSVTYIGYYDISNNWTTGTRTWDYTTQVAFANIQPDRPTSCAFALSGSALSFGAGAGTASVNLTTSSACAWTATSNSSFITLTSGASGTGSGTIGFSIAANTGTAARSGTLTIGGQTFTVTQAASTCTYAISPTSQSQGAGSGSGNINVTAGAACAWTAYSNASWLGISSGASGTGSGTIVYSVAANATTSQRSGTIAAAGQTFTVTQAAASCSYTVAPTRLSITSGATTGRLNVSALTGCAWSAASNASWLTVTGGASGSGEGAVSYSATANAGSASRTATITVGGQAFTLTQAGQVAAAIELLNADFENGHSGWTEEGAYDIITEDFRYSYSGSWFAWLAGYDNAKDRMYQAVTIPANATQATVQFWYGIDTEELPGGAYDKMMLEVYSGTTGNLLATLATFSNLNAGEFWVRSSAYDLSAYKGQRIFIAFSATSDSSLTTNFYVDDVKLTVAAAGTAAANYTALWWNPAESGWGINFNHQGDILFGTLFTYDSSGQGMWLVMTGGTLQANGSYSGPLYRTTGPAFNAVPFTPIGAANLTQVGTMTVSFPSASSGTLTYSVNGVNVSKTIQRQVYGSRGATCTPATGSRASLTNYQDLWWNSAESGWGVNVTHQDNTLFATLFTYDSTGRGMWLVMDAGVRQADGSYLGNLLRTTGPAFNANPFTPIGAANVSTVGTMRFRFTSGEAATLTYTVNGVSVSKAITRQVFSNPAPACTS